MKQKISILSSLTMNGGSSWGKGMAITWVCGVQEDTTHQSWKFGFRPSLQGILWESRGFRQKKKAGKKKRKKQETEVRQKQDWSGNQLGIQGETYFPTGKQEGLLLASPGMGHADIAGWGRQKGTHIFIRAKGNVHDLNSKNEQMINQVFTFSEATLPIFCSRMLLTLFLYPVYKLFLCTILLFQK